MLTKCISYIIVYYSKASQHYIGIINHGRNWLWIHGSADRKFTLRSGKNCFIFIFIKKLWQVLCHGHLIFLLSTWLMENDFPTHPLSLSYLENNSWVSEADISTRFPYFEFVWKYFSEFLVHWWRQKISPKRVAALIFADPSEISVSKPIDYSRGYLSTYKTSSTAGIVILSWLLLIWYICFSRKSILAAASTFYLRFLSISTVISLLISPSINLLCVFYCSFCVP